MGRPALKSANVHPVLAVVVTILILVGVIAVSYITQQQGQKPIATTQTIATVSSTEPIPELILSNESAVTLVHANGLMERLSYPAFVSTHPDSKGWPSRGVDVATGQERSFDIQGEGVQIPEGHLSPDRVFRALLKEPKSDGAGSIELRRPNETGRDVVLRTADGKPLKDAQLIGWFDSDEMAVTAAGTSTRAVYSVGIDGRVAFLGHLPEDVLYTSLSRGMLFAVTAMQDGGLEMAPRGPSEVFVFHADATGSIFRSDSVMTSFILDPEITSLDVFAYTSDSGVATLVEQGKPIVLGKVRPLLFTKNGDLLFRDGFDLMMRKKQDGKIVRIGALPEGAVKLYDFYNSL